MSAAPAQLPDGELRMLDSLVERALATGDESALLVLGCGEISLVLGWPADEPRFACKRLPVFDGRGRFDAYRTTLREYLAALGLAGVEVVSTELRGVERGDGSLAGYVVQPILPAETLGPSVLARAEPSPDHPLPEAIIAAAAAAVSPTLGLDAQLANWAWDGSRLAYLDVSTPLLWSSEDGPCRLDLDLLASAYPPILRLPLKRFVAPGVLDTYRDLRKVYFDLTGNLIKERLEGWLPHFLAPINERIERPITEHDVRRYYRSDARLWEILLRLRRLDRAWQRRVRRRPYPFLLPEGIRR